LAKRQSTARGLPLLARSISSRAINRTSSCPAACPACPVSPNRNCGMRAPRAAPRYGRRILPVRSGRCAMSDPPTAERARAFWVFDRPLHRDWLFLAGLAVGLVYGGYAVLRRDRASALVLAYELFWALPGGVLLAGAVGGTVREVVRALRRPQEPGTAAPSQPASRRKPPAAACRSGRPRTRPPCALRRPVWPSPTSPGCGSRASRGCSARSRAWTTSTSAPPTTATSSASSRPTRACAPATASCWRPSYGYPPAVDRAHGNAIGPEITDPSCLFDAATNRSYHVVLTIEVTTAGALLGPNHLDLAVSQTSSPLGGWTIYRLPVQDDGTQGTPTHVGCPCIGDYPHIGADKFGIHLTTNEYPLTDSPGLFGNGYNGAQIYSFSKASLAAGASVVNLVQFESPTLGDGTPSFTVWPAQSNPAEFATQDNGTDVLPAVERGRGDPERRGDGRPPRLLEAHQHRVARLGQPGAGAVQRGHRLRDLRRAAAVGAAGRQRAAARLHRQHLPGGDRAVARARGRGSPGLQRQPHAADLARRREAVRGAGHDRPRQRQPQGRERLVRGRPRRPGGDRPGLRRGGRQQRQLPGGRRAAERPGRDGLHPGRRHDVPERRLRDPAQRRGHP